MLDRDLAKVALHNSLYTITLTQHWVRQAVKDSGLKLVYFSDADKAKLLEVSLPIWDEIAKTSPRCGELMNIIYKQMRDIGRIK